MDTTRSLTGAADGSTPFGRYAAAAAGIAAIFIVNGAIRELGYVELVGEVTAHQLSALTVAPFVIAYVYALERRWPIASSRDALRVGLTWVVIAVAFEFGFGHYVDGASWSALLRDYDITTGHVWGLVLCFIAVAPALVWRAVRTRRERR
jgi:hypothetical protein